MKKRIVAVLLTGVLALSALTGCGSSDEQGSASEAVSEGTSALDEALAAGEDYDLEAEFAKESGVGEPIRIISTFEGTCQVQTQVAYLLGFYEQEGLVEGVDYEFVETGGETGAVLLSTDQADVAIGLISGMLQPLDNGLEAKAISGLHTGCVTIVTKGDSGINSVKNLVGKKIGVTALSSSQHIAALRALNYEGFSGDDVEFIVYDKDSIQQALMNGAVDAIGLGDYKAAIMGREEGTKIIFDTSTDERLKDENCCVLFASNVSIERKPATLAKLVIAIQKASVWISNNPELSAQIQAAQGYTVGDVNVNTDLLKTYAYPTSLTSLKEAVYRNFDDAKDIGLLKEDTDKDALAESSYLFLPGVPDGLDITEIEAPKDPQQFLTAKE
ncbi:ABC transporter substrate-binding protein [Butyrivibrio sp. YAB3001]|uniref:ABC transporter substrate-binding protein n=1 Tax=Butyrivibrio sp. YAB3001 TaxID=1520812 RepID=UPI0008F625AE|nr:ABC transporter substrate-binding protein [Butyrivibrio sp. YAB3001]SFB85211.1 NitT/TauT family transport system substrate-binding protein [Butyrivibrio sp. YAB3001]